MRVASIEICQCHEYSPIRPPSWTKPTSVVEPIHNGTDKSSSFDIYPINQSRAIVVIGIEQTSGILKPRLGRLAVPMRGSTFRPDLLPSPSIRVNLETSALHRVLRSRDTD